MEPRAHTPPLTLLLVDDTPANIVALKAVLDCPDYRILTANSGEEALRLVLHEDVHVILLDVVMPGMDGFEMARTLKAVARTSTIPILFLTAIATDVTRIYHAYDVGAVDYIVKPLDPELVRKKVAVFAELVRQRMQIEHHAEELRELQRRDYELRIAELRIAGDRRYRKLVDGINHAIAWTATESLQLGFVSRQASKVLGYPPEEFLKPDFWANHLHPDDRDEVLALFRRAINEGAELVSNHRMLASDGRTLWFHTGLSGERAIGSAPPELHGFSVDVTDLKLAEEAALRATQARDDLLAIVSHDLRNPLNAIKLSAGLIGRAFSNPEGTERAFKHAAIIIRAAESMERLIGELLDLAQLEAGGLAIARKPVDIGILVDETVDMFRPAASEKGLQLEVETSPSVIVDADRDRVLQIVSNLIGNAIKFSPGSGRVSVHVLRKGQEVLFSVSDTGPGIPADQLPKIWSRFWQSKREGGIGLGLTIAKALVEAHHGRIWADSRSGGGTTFYFTLPVSTENDAGAVSAASAAR